MAKISGGISTENGVFGCAAAACRSAGGWLGQCARSGVDEARGAFKHFESEFIVLGVWRWPFVLFFTAVCLNLLAVCAIFRGIRQELGRAVFAVRRRLGRARPAVNLCLDAANTLRREFIGRDPDILVDASFVAGMPYVAVTKVAGANVPQKNDPFGVRAKQVVGPLLRAMAARARRGFFNSRDTLSANRLSIALLPDKTGIILFADGTIYAGRLAFDDDGNPDLEMTAQFNPPVKISAHQRIAIERDFAGAISEIPKLADLTRLGLEFKGVLHGEDGVSAVGFGDAPTLFDAALTQIGRRQRQG